MGLTGLFFGSFNPVHNGHLAIARYLLDRGICTSVWFVVSPQNPWKTDHHLLDEEIRLRLVELAVAGDERMVASDIEFTMPRPSYTYQTLKALQIKYPKMRFSLIVGGDNLRNFHLWRNYKEILAGFPLLAYPRPGVDLPEMPEADIRVLNAPLFDISSTGIRERVAAGKDISGLVPETIIPLVQQYYTVR